MKIFGSLTPVNPMSTQLVKEIEAECALAAKGQSVDLKQTHAKILRLTQAFEQEVKNSRTAPSPQVIQNQKETVSRLTSRIEVLSTEVLSAQQKNMPAWVKPAAYTALAVAAVAGLAFAAYHMEIFSGVTSQPTPPKPDSLVPQPKCPLRPFPFHPSNSVGGNSLPGGASLQANLSANANLSTPAFNLTQPPMPKLEEIQSYMPTKELVDEKLCLEGKTSNLKKITDPIAVFVEKTDAFVQKVGQKIGSDTSLGRLLQEYPKSSGFTVAMAAMNLLGSISDISASAKNVFRPLGAAGAAQQNAKLLGQYRLTLLSGAAIALLKGAGFGAITSVAASEAAKVGDQIGKSIRPTE